VRNELETPDQETILAITCRGCGKFENHESSYSLLRLEFEPSVSRFTCSLEDCRFLNPIPGGKTGLPCPEENKYRNLALRVGGVSKIETIKYAHESRGNQSSERLRWRCQTNWKLQIRLLVREGASHNQIRNWLKIIKERRRKIVSGSQMGAWYQNRLVDWPSVVIWLRGLRPEMPLPAQTLWS
jgi:hypothetical protein